MSWSQNYDHGFTFVSTEMFYMQSWSSTEIVYLQVKKKRMNVHFSWYPLHFQVSWHQLKWMNQTKTKYINWWRRCSYLTVSVNRHVDRTYWRGSIFVKKEDQVPIEDIHILQTSIISRNEDILVKEKEKLDNNSSENISDSNIVSNKYYSWCK